MRGGNRDRGGEVRWKRAVVSVVVAGSIGPCGARAMRWAQGAGRGQDQEGLAAMAAGGRRKLSGGMGEAGLSWAAQIRVWLAGAVRDQEDGSLRREPEVEGRFGGGMGWAWSIR